MKTKHEPLKYDLVDLDLGEPHENAEIELPFAAVKIIAWELDGLAQVRLNRRNAPLLPLHQGDQLMLDVNNTQRFWHVYVSNESQPGKKLTLLLVSPPMDARRG